MLLRTTSSFLKSPGEVVLHFPSHLTYGPKLVLPAYICVPCAGGDTTVRVWRASDLLLVRVLRGHRGSVLTLLAVGSVLLSGARDNTIR